MKSAGKARNNGLYRHIRTSKEIIRNLLNDFHKKEDGAGKRHRPFVMAYTGRWGTPPPTNVVEYWLPSRGAKKL